MFIKTGHLHLTYLFQIIIVIRVLVSQSRSLSFKPLGGSKVNHIRSSFQGQLNEYQELLVTKL